MELLRSLYAGLHLTVNETRSAVASVLGRKFLGYILWMGAKGEIKRRVANKQNATFKQRIRQLWWKQRGPSGAAAAPLCAGMESVFWFVANAKSLANAG